MSSKKNQVSDERFKRVQKDPRFWEMPERERKIKIDKRFQSMFHDKRFKVKYTVDKRGRPINHTSTDDLKRFYKLSDSEDEDEGDEEEGKKAAAEGKEKKKKKKKGTEKLVKSRGGGAKGERPEGGVRVVEDEDDDDDDEERQTDEEEEEDGVDLGAGVTDGSEEEDEDEEDAEEESDAGSGSEGEESGLDSEEDGDSDSDSGPDLARGKGNVETSSDEDDDDDDVDAILRKEEEEIEHDWGELCKDAPRSDEVSVRLAICNMDWDRMKAKDLLALCSSFTPKGGAVLSVKIYPSDFGKERLKVEESQGPMELRALPDDSEDDTEEERVYREKKRDYQFKRLKYYYAVVECDSVDTAAKIYEECDGYEYESSCSVMDLRFIPDDVTFPEEPKDAATDVNLSAYTPKLFTSSAAATSKVQLTWDETDHERVTALNRKFNKDELLEMDFNAYLASSSEEEEEDEDGDVEEEKPEEEEEKTKKTKKKKSEEQISKYRELLRGLQDREKKLQEDKDMQMEITWVPGLKETTEQLVKKKLEGNDQLTPWEEFLQKKKERKKQKKSQRKQEDDLSDDELPPDVDLSDPFFAEELGATDPKKKQKGKKKKQEEEERTAEEEEELERQKAEMALLMEDDAGDAKHKHFNYDKIVEQQNLSKKKRKKLLKKGAEPAEDDQFQVDVQDPRFQAMFTSHLFNLDPSHPSYKKTKATQSLLAEKQRRREEERRQKDDVLAARATESAAGATRENDSDAPAAKKPMDPGLSLLVKSIKSKTEQFQARKKQKLV
ncbi:ESF1 homolog [Seriola dumerili]|uniref:ESF1 homolog n=1 Tax=Seriola dumerili TaxID=41447 RepID=UPI000BBEC5D4|nr:ESF1 homolog [Seriola dumerili]